jgi:mannose-6-phosphate isomerase class I
MSYDPSPRYPVVGGRIELGYDALAAELVRQRPPVVAVDGPAALEWGRLTDSLRRRVEATGLRVRIGDVREFLAPWPAIERLTAAADLPGDPVFGRLYDGPLSGFFAEQPSAPTSNGADVSLLLGPGSALARHDTLWYVDRPKRMTLSAVRRGLAGNLGQPAGAAGTERKLLFVDWPVLDRHQRALARRVDRYVDLSDSDAPRSVTGSALRRSLGVLAEGPFRTRPTFLPGPWGGQWLRRELGVPSDAENLAWSYELITPESGVLLGAAQPLEVAFELLMAEQGEQILGPSATERFGLSFPIRFDYLDTFRGGHLSIQCHPSERYMRRTFGLPYTQHETYYVMATSPGATIFLGLREDADVESFRADAERAVRSGVPFEPERYLQTHRAEPHRLYLIPAGTPHASGAGNVVLEISATPYLYTLRFYDWLRRDLNGVLRPVHLRHAFANLDARRRGTAVRRDLIPRPRLVRDGRGWSELELGRSPELFFAVHRYDFDREVSDDTDGRFHVLNLVAGSSVEIETEAGRIHPLSYAETIVVPAITGHYRVRPLAAGPCKLVKAFVP